jgi:hypothetical protein
MNAQQREAIVGLCTCLNSPKNHCYHRDIAINIPAISPFPRTFLEIQIASTAAKAM